MTEFERIKSIECRPGESAEYCKIRAKIFEIEKTADLIFEAITITKNVFKDREYFEPFRDLTNNFADDITTAKEKITDEILRREVKNINPNVNVDEKLNTDEIISQMDFKKLIDNINLKYAAHEDITFDEILKLAKDLVPYSGGIEISKNKLILRHYCLNHTKDYSTNRPIIEPRVYDCAPKIIALGKLANIVIDEVKPSQANTGLKNIHSWESSLFSGSFDVYDKSINAIKFFKNEKLEVTFAKPEQAEKMRKVLELL